MAGKRRCLAASLAQPDKSRADQALELGVALDGELHAYLANSLKQQPAIADGVKLGEFAQACGGLAPRLRVLVRNAGDVILQDLLRKLCFAAAKEFLT